ncbi:hypothetical protein N7468_008486 [Penicillium chermesinum]|uniref:Uncharacterized protein n=1 Tax=Penicillium chermesinum TaxID=63820 RepID=A0A9W9NSP4_9EURO|nr:uncharacterized protein N7468_008486 [Penicillium chermesinum]KAJ5223944.1 hypothetical protein N7468_008486 [Penicillium chermesinum]KAJ6155235.1 hypothetical protein N7470_005801 [Penicillium chermesinum]
MNFFRSKPTQPAKVVSDHVIPLRAWDTALAMKGTVLDATLVFQDILDVSTLREGLVKLYSTGNWRQLGARLRSDESGALEYHIPQSYDDVRPAFIFTNAQHEVPVESCPSAAAFLKTPNNPTILPSPATLNGLSRGENAPTKLEDWIYADHPQLFIHTATFLDATIVTVTFPHTLTDVMGIGIFMKAWSAMVQGNLGAVPALESFESDPLTQLGQKTPAKKYRYYDKVLNKSQLLMFVGRRLIDSFWYRQEERRTIFLSADSVRKLREQALQELSDSGQHGCAEFKRFVSESDVLLAWWGRMLYTVLSLPPSQRIMIHNALNLRTSLHDSFSAPENVYLGNCVCMSPIFVDGQQLETESLGSIAWRNRQSVAEQQTPEQVEAITALLKETMEKSGYLALVGEPGMAMFSSSNWHRAGLYGVDFSSASPSDRMSSIGKPTYVNGVLHSHLSFRNTFAVTGRDAGGNWWLNGVLRTDAWEGVERALKSLG